MWEGQGQEKIRDFRTPRRFISSLANHQSGTLGLSASFPVLALDLRYSIDNRGGAWVEMLRREGMPSLLTDSASIRAAPSSVVNT